MARYKESEGDFQRRVIDLAEWHGWRVYHVSNVKGRLRSRTGEGYPDLALLRETMLHAELKTDTAQPTAEQCSWIDGLHAAGYYSGVWRPRDWDAVVGILASPEGTLKVRPAWRGEWKHRSD